MALDYQDGAWVLDGEPVTDDELATWRDQMADQWAADLGQVAIYELGITGEQPSERDYTKEAIALFALAFMRCVSDIVATAYMGARGGIAAVPEREWRAVVDIVVRQQMYANGFAVALAAGMVSQAQVVARARQYAGAGIEAFSMGLAARLGFHAPAHPTQGCKGGGNCRCYWSIVELPDRIEGTWKAVGDSETCEVCRQRAGNWAPYVQQKSVSSEA